MTETNRDITYRATKIAAAFHASRVMVRMQMGPVGCGKSVSSAIETMLKSAGQLKNRHGIRRTRWLIIRGSYPELISTTIPTWLEWFPEEVFGKMTWDSPIEHMIKINDIEMQVWFMPVSKHADVKKLRSLEVTGVLINEAQYLPQIVFDTALERINRFPPPRDGVPITWTGLIADTNPPPDDHWIYKLFEEQRPEGYEIFHYAPALIKLNSEPIDGTPFKTSLNGSIYINNPDADYRFVVADTDYWLKMVPGRYDDYINVNLCGNYGFVKSGLPVHPEYNDRLHYANKPLKYDPKLELGLGWDFGLTPACAVVQLTTRGQLVVLDELWTDHMSLRDFAQNIVLPHLDRNYSGWRNNYASRHDPAGAQESQTDGRSCAQILQELKINSYGAAKNNAPTPRRDSLKFFFGKMVDGSPAFILSNKCNRLRKGLNGEFKYAEINASANGETRYHEKPLKNSYSHICEGLEYIAMEYCTKLKLPASTGKKAYKVQSGSFMGH